MPRRELNEKNYFTRFLLFLIADIFQVLSKVEFIECKATAESPIANLNSCIAYCCCGEFSTLIAKVLWNRICVYDVVVVYEP